MASLGQASTSGHSAAAYTTRRRSEHTLCTCNPCPSARIAAATVQARPAATATTSASGSASGSGSTTPSVFDRMRGTVSNAANSASNVASSAWTTTSNSARTATTAATRTVTSATTAVRDYWGAHISQFRNRFNPNGPSMAPNCGPAAVTTALRLIGRDIPGYSGQVDQRVIDSARIIATGKNDTRVGTTDTELERVVSAAGAKWSESTNLDQLLGWVQGGTPVMLAGNPWRAWDTRYSRDQVYPFDGGHWVVVSGYDVKTGYYVVNDPLSTIGPIYVSKAELQTYFSRNGGLGIAVYN